MRICSALQSAAQQLMRCSASAHQLCSRAFMLGWLCALQRAKRKKPKQAWSALQSRPGCSRQNPKDFAQPFRAAARNAGRQARCAKRTFSREARAWHLASLGFLASVASPRPSVGEACEPALAWFAVFPNGARSAKWWKNANQASAGEFGAPPARAKARAGAKSRKQARNQKEFFPKEKILQLTTESGKSERVSNEAKRSSTAASDIPDSVVS